MRRDPELDEAGEADLRRVERFAAALIGRKFFGKVTFTLNGGRLQDARTEEVHKPSDLG
jgi:hypothetical protein